MARNKTYPLIIDFNNIPKEALVPEEEQPYPLPEHWKWVISGSVVEPMKTRKPAGKTFTYIDIESVNNKQQVVEFPKTLASNKAPSRASRAVHFGDTLFSLVRPYLRNIAFVTQNLADSIASTGFYVCTPVIAVHPKYLFHVLRSNSFVTRVVKYMKGDNSPSVKISDFKKIPFPLPPLEEQKQIVAYLDEKLGKIDSVREKLQDFLDHADRRKANLIQAGITGHLTHQWRELHGSAREDWITKTVDELGAVVTGGTPSTKYPEFYGSDVPFIKPADLNAGRHVTSSATYLSLLGSEQARMLPPNTVAVCCIGATISKCGLIEVESATNQQINALVPYEENSPTYLYYLCASPSFKQMVINDSSSTTLPILNKGRFSKLKVTVPSLDEQQEIARILDEQLARITAADSKVQEALDQLNLLKEQLVSAALAGRFSNAK